MAFTATAFKKGSSYWFSVLEVWAQQNNHALSPVGRFVTIARQQVLVLTENRDGADPMIFVYDKQAKDDSYKRVV